MAKQKGIKIYKGRIRGSYLTTILSMTLVLFLLGIVSYLMLNAQQLSEHVRENICFSIRLKDDAREPDVVAFKKNLDKLSFVRYTEYIPKDVALKSLTEELGEEFSCILDENPLWSSIDLYLESEYANPDSVAVIEKRLSNYETLVEGVSYQKDLLYAVNKNIKSIALVFVGFAVLLILISFALINNTIRLMVYSKRFLIKTMRLVGATKSFIRRPFLISGVWQGILSALFASALLAGLIYVSMDEFKTVISLTEWKIIIPLFLMVLGLGIIISYISTLLSVNKYLRIKSENLYY